MKTIQVEDIPITRMSENEKDSTNLKGPRSIRVHRLEDEYVILRSCSSDETGYFSIVR